MLLSSDIYRRPTFTPEKFWVKSCIFLGITLAYFLLGYFGLELATVNKNASPIWPASGLAVGCIILFGNRYLPAVFFGSLMVNFSVETPLIGLLGAAFGNLIEAYVGSQIAMYAMRKNFFKLYSEFFAILSSSVFASLFSASLGVFSLNQIGIIPDSSYLYAWYTWWSGNAIGILLVLPVFIEISLMEKRPDINFKKILSSFGLLCLIGVSIYFVFVKGYNQAFAWVLSPLLILSGMFLGRMYSRILLILIAFAITALTATGFGPFEHGNTNTNLIYVQSILASYAFAILFVRPLNTNYKLSSKYLIGVTFGWLSMFVVIFMTTSYEKRHTRDDFKKSEEAVTRSLTRLGGRYESMMKGTAALFKVDEEVTEDEWKTYSSAIELDRYFDAINGLGFVEYVPKSKLAEYEKKNKVKVRFIGVTHNQYDHHLVMKFIAPYERNKEVIGYDIGSGETRRRALNRSLNNLEPTASEPLTLIQDTQKRPGFIVVYPVFDRKNKLKGFINAPVISSIFFGTYLDQFAHNLQLKISSRGHVVHSTKNFPGNEVKHQFYYDVKKIKLFGITHRIEFYPTESFFSIHSASSAGLALLLNIFVLFIAAFLLEQLTFSQKAEALIEQRTRELEISKIQLINASKMASLGEMASGMAHEINNPLAIIQGKVKVISMMLEELEIRQPSVFLEIHKIKLTTDRIDKIVKGLRNFSRASNNDPFEPVLVQKLLHETLDLCSEKFKAHGIDLRINRIPDVSILCRPSQISQVFINLLNNSSDAIEELHDKWIEIDFKLNGNKLCIYFTDSGSGIPAEIATKIMEPFFTTKEVRKGTGLGLSIAKTIIDSHAGTFWLDREHPNTRFVIEFSTQS